MTGMDVQSWTVKPYIHHHYSTKVRKQHRAKTSAGEKLPVTSIVERRPRPIVRPETSPSSDESYVEPFFPRIPDNGAEDPFWTFAVDYEPAISPIFAHCTCSGSGEPQDDSTDVAQISRTLQLILRISTNQTEEVFFVESYSHYAVRSKPLLTHSLLTFMAVTEAAAMYAVLLMGASHYCAVNPGKASLIDLLAIKARALSEINTAIADQKKAVTDATIIAVAKMAAYESIFGDSRVFAAHMLGLQKMLKLRGGLATLGLNGLLERMVVWIDLNACHLTGLSVHLGTEEHPTKVAFEAPDPFHFAGIC